MPDAQPKTIRPNFGPPYGAWLKWLLTGNRYHTHISLLLVFGALYCGVILWLSQSPPELLSMASALTERVYVTVADGTKAAFPVDGMRIASADAALDGQCLAGLLTPAPMTVIVYGRVGEGHATVKLFPSPDNAGRQRVIGTLLRPDGTLQTLTKRAYFETGVCPSAAMAGNIVQLPIWGQVSLGTEYQPIAQGGAREPTMLLSGHLRVMARSILGGFIAPELYPVADLTLPVGSRLEAEMGKHGRGPANWWGIAYVDPQKPALVVEVASDARALALYRPNIADADIIEVSALEQLFSDPNFVWLQIVFGSLLFLGQIAGFVAGWRHSKQDVA